MKDERESLPAEREKMTRKQRAEATKRRIFDNALALLLERGYEKITVRDIVEAADVSIGSFYNYYESKLDVYYETYSVADEYFETVVAEELEGKGFAEQYFLFFDHYARYSSEVTGLSLTKLLYSSDNKSFDRGAEAGMHALLIRILREGLESGAIAADRPAEELFQFFFIAARGLVYNWCTNDGGYDLRRAMAGYMGTLLRAFRAGA